MSKKEGLARLIELSPELQRSAQDVTTRREREEREIARDYYNDLIGGLENSYVDGNITDEDIAKLGYTLMSAIEEAVEYILTVDEVVTDRGNWIEGKNLRFLGKERITEIVTKLYKKLYIEDDGWDFPHTIR